MVQIKSAPRPRFEYKVAERRYDTRVNHWMYKLAHGQYDYHEHRVIYRLRKDAQEYRQDDLMKSEASR